MVTPVTPIAVSMFFSSFVSSPPEQEIKLVDEVISEAQSMVSPHNAVLQSGITLELPLTSISEFICICARVCSCSEILGPDPKLCSDEGEVEDAEKTGEPGESEEMERGEIGIEVLETEEIGDFGETGEAGEAGEAGVAGEAGKVWEV